MGAYSGYLIVSDIDGTLVVDGNLPPENLTAIEKFQAEGGRFTLCTGRSPSHIRRFPFACNAPIATINGTLLCSERHKPLVRMHMEEDYHDVIRTVIGKFPGIRQVDRYHEAEFVTWQRTREGDDLSALLPGAPCYKFFLICDEEPTALSLMAYITENHSDRYEVNRSFPCGVEIHKKGTGKGACIREMRKLLPDVRTIIAAGDYENDITMLKEADIGCAVGNAIPSVKAAADRVICRNDEFAIAYIINTLIPSLPTFGKSR